MDLVSRQLADSIRKSFLWGFIVGGILVLFLLLAHFENFAGIFYSIFPVIGGVIAMLGLMALTGLRLNFVNSMVLVTILGMGSDYGLHVMHRVSGASDMDAEGGFVQSGRAVLLSALTTIAGFGSLAFTDYAPWHPSAGPPTSASEPRHCSRWFPCRPSCAFRYVADRPRMSPRRSVHEVILKTALDYLPPP